MIMKKFYSLIFTGAFLLTSFLSQAQVFNSITSNPSGFTLDDSRFWQGGVAPGNPCNNCTIKINSDVIVVPQNGGTAANGGKATTAIDGAFLNHVVVSNSTINVYGNTTLTLNSYLTLDNSTITIGNDPTSTETIFVNDQVDLINGSSVQLANGTTVVDATNFGPNAKSVLIGPYSVGVPPGPVVPLPGIYAVRPTNPSQGSVDFTLNKLTMSNWNGTYTLAKYLLNCGGPTQLPCGVGVIFGPAKTIFDMTLITPPNGPPIQGFIGFEESVTLPVVLVQFVATKNDDGTVKISWATSQEQNSAYYDVERSGDQTAWTKIGSVQAKGYASTTTNYSFSDNLPIKGTGYYRLKMVDQDGKFTYSKAVAVTSGSSDVPLVIYSNPFNDQIRLKVNVSMGQNLIMTVSDMMGKTYISQTYQAQAGDNYINLQPATTANGMYVLHIHGNSYDQTVKLERQ